MSENAQSSGMSMDMGKMMTGIQQMLGSQLPPEEYGDFQQTECRIPMPDGVALHGTLFRPAETESCPVILMRNPYRGNDMMNTAIYGPAFAKHGYAYLTVDVRGALKSEGEWLPFENERRDGRAVIDWIAAQSWCDGNIGTMGSSYLGHTQWCIADYPHPALKAMYIGVYGIHPYHTFYRRGMFRPELWTTWAAQMMEDNRWKMMMPPETYELARKAWEVRPANCLGETLKGKHCGWYEKWISSTRESDAYWSGGFWKELEESVNEIRLPVFLHGGWFDIFLRSQIDTFRRLPEAVREKSRFVIGPWNHSGMTGGCLEYPNEDALGLFQLKSALEWFDYQLKGKEYPHALGAVEAYQIGQGTWEIWKGGLAQGKRQDWYLHADGSMDRQRQTQGSARSYTYDPADPVRTCGGNLLVNNRDPMGTPECSTWQPDIGSREDVLSFRSEVFDRETKLVGSIGCRLWVASGAPATAFTVKVCEEFADGRSVNIRDDITDIRWLDDGRIQDYTPGTIRELKLDLVETCWQIKAGSRLRVDISSSNFPAYHAHPNVTGCWAAAEEVQPARQTVYFDGGHASCLMLPVQK